VKWRGNVLGVQVNSETGQKGSQSTGKQTGAHGRRKKKMVQKTFSTKEGGGQDIAGGERGGPKKTAIKNQHKRREGGGVQIDGWGEKSGGSTRGRPVVEISRKRQTPPRTGKKTGECPPNSQGTENTCSRDQKEGDDKSTPPSPEKGKKNAE